MRRESREVAGRCRKRLQKVAFIPGRNRYLAARAGIHADRAQTLLTALAGLGLVQHTAFTPEARSVDAGWLKEALGRRGFGKVEVGGMIPEMTMLAQGRKPA